MLKKKLLLADDDIDDRNFFFDFFEDRPGFELMPAAENGLEVIELLNLVTDQELPDLIILDHNMPRMNGKQTLEFLKSTTRYAAIPIIIYSTYSSKQLIDECSVSGASLVATKPITYEAYQIMMNQFLGLL